MIAYVARRLALLVPTLLGVSIVAFLVVHWMPGDPAEILAGEHASKAVVEQIRHDLGLDLPLPHQYGRWVAALLHGDLGRSAKTHERITVEIARTFPATVELATAALILASVGGVLLGLVAARRPGGAVDAGSMSIASVGVSMPVFWLGLLLMYTFAVRFPVLPVSGRGLATDDTPLRTGFLVIDALIAGRPAAALTTLRHLVLPAIVLGTVPTAIIARVTRSSLVEVLGRDYIRTARAKGLDEWRVLVRHAVRNGVLPTLTVIGLQFGALLGGAIITETIFSWPGIGRWILLGVEGRDAAVLQAGVLLMALAFSLVNLVTDLLYAALDPRIKLE